MTQSSVSVAAPLDAYLSRQDEIDGAIQRVLLSGSYIQGVEGAAFEEEFGRYLNVPHVLGTASGTDALQLALRACGIGPGDYVVTVSHTATATVAAIDLVGATPLLVDVDPMTQTLDPDALDAVMRSRMGRLVRAVIPVHLYGHPADMRSIMRIAKEYGLKVIEDCAQSHGADIDGRKAGSFGHFGAFSFYPTKNLGALGDGGAVVTTDRRLAEYAGLLKQYGWKERYVSEIAGMNTRLDELQAAILRTKLVWLDDDNERRRRNAKAYAEVLYQPNIMLPAERPGARHVYHQFVIQTPGRDELRSFLSQHGIGTAVLYPVPLHLQPGYHDRAVVGPGGVRETERLCNRILSLPVHPSVTESQIRHAASLIMEWTRAAI